MERIYHRIEERVAEAREHALFGLIHSIDAPAVPAFVRAWATQFIHLTMTFRDINLLYMAYPRPADAFERTITAHAQVDATHWALLMSDLRLLGIGGDASLETAVRLIWADDELPMRHYIYSLAQRAISCGDSPFLRAACMEAGEATVKTFFTASRAIARKFQSVTGMPLQYFGDAHIDSELETPVDAALFRTEVLPAALLPNALSLVDQHFDRFGPFLDHKLARAQRALTETPMAGPPSAGTAS